MELAVTVLGLVLTLLGVAAGATLASRGQRATRATYEEDLAHHRAEREQGEAGEQELHSYASALPPGEPAFHPDEVRDDRLRVQLNETVAEYQKTVAQLRALPQVAPRRGFVLTPEAIAAAGGGRPATVTARHRWLNLTILRWLSLTILVQWRAATRDSALLDTVHDRGLRTLESAALWLPADIRDANTETAFDRLMKHGTTPSKARFWAFRLSWGMRFIGLRHRGLPLLYAGAGGAGLGFGLSTAAGWFYGAPLHPIVTAAVMAAVAGLSAGAALQESLLRSRN